MGPHSSHPREGISPEREETKPYDDLKALHLGEVIGRQAACSWGPARSKAAYQATWPAHPQDRERPREANPHLLSSRSQDFNRRDEV